MWSGRSWRSRARKKNTRVESELARVNQRLKEMEQGFLNDLDRVDRGIMTEPEYLKRQEVRRQEQEEVQPLKAELEVTVQLQKDTEATVTTVPAKVQSFLEDFQRMDVREAKAVLQSILKAAHVFSDGRLEIEFRS